MSDKRYTVDGKDGWLNIKRKPLGMVVAVPEFAQCNETPPIAGL